MRVASEVGPAPLDDVLAAIGDRAPCWVVDGQWASERGFRRACVLVLSGSREPAPELVWDGFLEDEDLYRLAQILGARRGTGDAMFATPWTLWWSCDSDPLQILDGAGVLVRARNGLLHVRDVGVVRPVRVEAWAADDWIRRGVRLVDALGDTIQVAEVHEWSAAVDPTYDWIDLDCDARWARHAAHAIGRALGIPTRVTWD